MKMKRLFFLISAFLMWVWVTNHTTHAQATQQQCLDLLSASGANGSKPITIPVNNLETPEAFFEAMTKGMILNPHQKGLFGFYRTVFGNSKTFIEKDLETVHAILNQHPSLLDEKILFREVHVDQTEKTYSTPDTLKTFRNSILKSMGQTRSNLFNIDANLGFWKKLLMPPLEKKDKKLSKEEKQRLNIQFKERLNSLVPIEVRNQLKETNSDNFSKNTKILFDIFYEYEK